MFCRKRGQVTIYIILGIIIAAALIVVFSLSRSSSENVKASSFQNKVDSIKAQIIRCLKNSAESAVYELADEEVGNYETELESRIKTKAELCMNFDTYNGLVVEQDEIKSLNAAVSEGKTKITVDMVRPVKITDGDKEARLSSFSTEIKLLKQCCIPVEVDDECRALEGGEYKACGIMLKLDKGQKVLYGGNCVAC